MSADLSPRPLRSQITKHHLPLQNHCLPCAKPNIWPSSWGGDFNLQAPEVQNYWGSSAIAKTLRSFAKPNIVVVVMGLYLPLQNHCLCFAKADIWVVLMGADPTPRLIETPNHRALSVIAKPLLFIYKPDIFAVWMGVNLSPIPKSEIDGARVPLPHNCLACAKPFIPVLLTGVNLSEVQN